MMAKIADETEQHLSGHLLERQRDIKSRVTISSTIAHMSVRAAEELDVYTSVSKTRRKESQYSDKGKLTGETVTEKESRKTYRDVIDRSGLKQLTAALKDLRDIQSALAQEREGFVGGVVEIAAVAEEGQELEEEENQDG